MTDPVKIDISIIVCTYERPESLARLLSSFNNLRIEASIVVEFIIVNNSTDQLTDKVITTFRDQSPHRVVCCHEGQKGLSFARNHACRIAQGELLLFTDDDCVPSENWVEEILILFSTVGCDAAGGRVKVVEPKGGIPDWIKKNIDIFWGPLASFDLGHETRRYVDNMPEFVGANMCIRKRCISELGEFRIDLGIGSGAVGEDTEYCRRLIEAKKNVWYSSTSIIHHHLSKEHLTISYIFRWYIAKVRFLMRANQNSSSKKVFTIAIGSFVKTCRLFYRLAFFC